MPDTDDIDDRFFEEFDEWDVEVGEGVLLHGRSSGAGPARPSSCCTGIPRTHTTWYRVAPLIRAAGYTVVCPDLRGYGRSSTPPTSADHMPYSKRSMAADMHRLMQELGHARFVVVGHDRGSYVAMRLALDHPTSVTALGVLDSVPIGEALARADARFATAWWHWFFLAQPDIPERVILADPDAWYHGDPVKMGTRNFADYHRAIHDPSTVTAMIEDYRAGLGADRAADDADRAAGATIACPTLVAWSRQDDLSYLYGDLLAVWRPWAPDLRGALLNCGHHMAEEAPVELVAALIHFFDRLAH